MNLRSVDLNLLVVLDAPLDKAHVSGAAERPSTSTPPPPRPAAPAHTKQSEDQARAIAKGADRTVFDFEKAAGKEKTVRLAPQLTRRRIRATP